MNKKLKKSFECWEKAEKIIPAGTQTLSKSPTQFVYGVAPIYLKSGKGCRVYDVDGNEYIDYSMALGPIILGYSFPDTNHAIKEQLKEGIIFTLMHPLEIELSELLIKTIPCAEMVRFGKNGSDVTTGAVRTARAYTGKDMIACCGYHGWQDWYICTKSRNRGVPDFNKKLIKPFKYNDIDSLYRIFRDNKDKIAGVIMEPVGVVEPENCFLEKVKELTHKNKALLIFDEVITGFRVSLGGAQEYFKVTPDLACFGKAMANGMPISSLVGKRKYMKVLDDVFFSFTFGGETLSINAAIATIKYIEKNKVIKHIWEMGAILKDGYNRLSKEYGVEKFTECIGLPPRTVITFKDNKGKESLLMKSYFQQECIGRKILFSAAHMPSFSHRKRDVDYTLKVYRDVMRLFANTVRRDDLKDRIRGKVISPVFRDA